MRRAGVDLEMPGSMRADELRAESNVDGVATWRAIIRAIEELQRGGPMRRCSKCLAC